MNGPIFVTGAEPGDALKVEILRMTPIRATGWTRASLAGNVVDPEFVRGLPPRDKVELADRPAGADGDAGACRRRASRASCCRSSR